MKVHDFNKLSEPIDNDARRRARVEVHRAEAVAEIVAHNLAELRRARDLTQVELARALKTTQPNVARIEHQGDLFLSTLRNYVEALGGELELTAVFSDARLPLAVLGTTDVEAQRGEELAMTPKETIG